MSIRQVETKTTTLKSIMTRAAFVRGFTESKYGVPMDYDAYMNDGDDGLNERWYYERGRLLGVVFKGELKYGRRVTYSAQLAVAEMIHSGAMI